ncbi:MAG: mannonate dehydratase [Bacteroidia bacterium]
MLQSWRWFGPADPVTLSDIAQAGARGIVTALHHLPNGAVWTSAEIEARQSLIEAAGQGLHWAVVESIPVHEAIKRGLPAREAYIDAYCESLRNLGRAGVQIVCYNFMPVLDWTRTDLSFAMPDGSRALRFDAAELAAFDLYILRRPGAAADYSPDMQALARTTYERLDDDGQARLTRNLIAGLPGAEEGYSPDDLREALAAYADIDAARLRANLVYFLERIIPAAAAAGVRMAIHPDDPPFPILGLPRVVSTEADVQALFQAVPSYYNGLTFCTGSFGVRADNDLPGMFRRLSDRIHFIHLRSTRRDALGNFFEADHLDGDVDMYAVVEAIVREEWWRKASNRHDVEIPMRPDHGHQMLDDLDKRVNPGYSAIGRLRGLAEIRGLELGIRRALRPGAPA